MGKESTIYGLYDPKGKLLGMRLETTEDEVWQSYADNHFYSGLLGADKLISNLKAEGYRCVPVTVTESEGKG